MPPEYTVHKLEAASHYTIDNHFVGRLRGLFMAPRSAYYRFVIRGDDVSQLYFGNTGDDTNMVSLINVGSKEEKNLFPTLNPICDPNPNLKPQNQAHKQNRGTMSYNLELKSYAIHAYTLKLDVT